MKAGRVWRSRLADMAEVRLARGLRLWHANSPRCSRKHGATRSTCSPRTMPKPALRKGRSSCSSARLLAKGEVSDEALDAFLACKALPRGVKDAASEAARDLGVPRKRAYARALELKDRA